MKWISSCSIALFAAALAAAAYAHSVRTIEAERFIKEADAIAVAVIQKIEIKSEPCSIEKFITVQIEKVLRGSIRPGPVTFHLEDYIWNEKAGCPSVSYGIAPRANDLKEGTRIIVTVRSGRYPTDTSPEGNWVTSSYDMDKMDEVMR
jgi:hypothetical protein